MVIIMNIITMIVIVICTIIIAKVVNLIMNLKGANPVHRISFKESLDLTQLPIITLINGDKKFNFLLDTGASYSVVNEAVLEDLQYEETGEKGTLYGIDGNIKESGYIKMDVQYKDQVYEESFQVVDLSQSFGNIKEEFGINLHGVLGSSFFQKYRYILDFNELIAYPSE